MKPNFENLFQNKTVALLGAGVSNLSVADAALSCAKGLTIRDQKTVEVPDEREVSLTAAGAVYIRGEEYLRNLTEDVIFRSPGMRPDLPELTRAVEGGSVLTSEMELFLSLCPCPVYAITGSDGKTTTTTLTSLMLQPKGQVYLGGNIGDPLLYRYPMITENDAVAVELSSFQLMTVDAPVEAAAITNVTPNHLNWHTGMDEYIEAKRRILRHAKRAVLNYDNDVTREMGKDLSIPVTYFSLQPIPAGVLREDDSAVWLENDEIRTFYPGEGIRTILARREIKLPGLHNVANYMTAIAVTHGMTTEERIREVARTFGGVEHRLEFVREVNGVTFINGSIDSSPTRTAAALSALADRPVVLIAGGYDKHIPYEPLAEAVFASSVHTAVLTGDTGKRIREAMEAHPLWESKKAAGFRVIEEGVFEEAVKKAAEVASAGDTVILSPASASFDRFENFAERGRYFKKLVQEL